MREGGREWVGEGERGGVGGVSVGVCMAVVFERVAVGLDCFLRIANGERVQ